jgi:hypothetical protein
MALLFMDGFDAEDFSSKWTGATTSTMTTTASSRFGAGKCLTNLSSPSFYVTKAITPSARVTAGCACYLAQSNDYIDMAFFGDGASTRHVTITVNAATRLLEVHRGLRTGTLLATGTTAITASVWTYIEAQTTISDTTGTVTVRINGSATPDISFTGDTKNGGTNTTIDGVQFLIAPIFGANCYMDDVYILNSTGSANTDFLGDVRVHTLFPSNNGAYSQLTGSDGNSVDNYQLIDEEPFSSTDYAGASATGSRDTYTMANLPVGVSGVLGVQSNFVAAKSDSQLISAKPALLSGGGLYYGATRVLSAPPYCVYSDMYNTNPATSSSWTVADVNNLESGMEVV